MRLETVRVERWMSILKATIYERVDREASVAFGIHSAIVLIDDASVGEAFKVIFASALEFLII
jgi:hypothetical protein